MDQDLTETIWAALRVDHPVAARAQAADQAEVAWGAVVPQAAPVVVAHREVGPVVALRVDHPVAEVAPIGAVPAAVAAQAVDLEAEARPAVVAVIGEAPADLAALPAAVVHRVGAAAQVAAAPPVEEVAVDQVHQAEAALPAALEVPEAEAEAAHKVS